MKLFKGYKIDKISNDIHIYKTTYNLFYYYSDENIICINANITNKFVEEFNINHYDAKNLIKELLILYNIPNINKHTKTFDLFTNK